MTKIVFTMVHRKIQGLVKQAAEEKCCFVSVPECFAFVGRGPLDTIGEQRSLSSSLFLRYCALAKEHNVWISYGGYPVKEGGATKSSNTHVIVDNHGIVVASYEKMHLFDVDTADGSYKESSFIERGSRLVVVENTPISSIGLSICYDLRFPALYTALRMHGAKVILVPSAFMCR